MAEATLAPGTQDFPDEVEVAIQEERVFVATQWQLMWWRFRKHQLAMAGAIVVILFYLITAFAGFLAYADPHASEAQRSLMPPQRRICSRSWRLSQRPCRSLARAPSTDEIESANVVVGATATASAALARMHFHFIAQLLFSHAFERAFELQTLVPSGLFRLAAAPGLMVLP